MGDKFNDIFLAIFFAVRDQFFFLYLFRKKIFDFSKYPKL